MQLTKISDDIISKLVGTRPSLEGYQLIDQDTDGFLGDDLIFCFRTEVISEELENIAKDCLLDIVKKAESSNRGIIAGPVSLQKINKGKRSKIVGLVSPENFKSQVIFQDGSISSYKVSNTVHSMIVGYYDKAELRNPGEKNRATAYNKKHPEKWEDLQQVIQEVNDLYQEYLPDEYEDQLESIEEGNQNKIGIIKDTVYSTGTINYNLECAIHKDSNNAEGSISALLAFGSWEGSYLCLPSYNIAINVRPGDVLFFNAQQEYHFNSPLILDKDDWRMSMVLYLRNGFVNIDEDS